MKVPDVVDAKDCHANLNEWATFEHHTSCDIDVHHELTRNGANTLEEAPVELEWGLLPNRVCVLGEG